MYIVIVCDYEITHRSYAICRDKIYIKFYGSFLWMGCNCLKARQSHYERQFTFYQKFLVLIRSKSERRKGEMTLKPSSDFEPVYRPSYYQI